jgi:lipoprotein signal peptidase
MIEVCNYKYTLYPIVFVLTLICFLFVYLYLVKRTVVTNMGALLVVLGGTLNIIEWYQKGCVTDNIRLFQISLYNMNDLLIMVGLGILLAVLTYDKRP